jgi:outer membrane protein assembly factor BamB
VFVPPAVAGENLYVGSCAGMMYCLDRKTGAVKWKYDVTQDGGQSFHGNMLIDGEWIIVGTDIGMVEKGGNLYSFKLASGEVRWKYPAGRGVSTDLLKSGSTLLAVAEIGREEVVLGVDLNTGKEIWSVALPLPEGKQLVINKSPALLGERLYYGAADGKLYAFATATGEKSVIKDFGAPIITPIVTREGFFYFGTEAGKLYRVVSASGEIAGEFALNGRPYQPVVAGESIALFVNWMKPDGELLVLDADLKKVRWRAAPPAARMWILARPILWKNLLLSGADDGQMIGFNLHDGKPTWSQRLEGAVRTFMSHDGICYIGTIEGKIFALLKCE